MRLWNFGVGVGFGLHPAGALLLRRLRLGSVVITTNVENIPSRKTAERLGCALERIAPVPPEYRALCAGAVQKCRYIWRVDA